MPAHFGLVRLFATPWTAACQAPLSVGFSRQECCPGESTDRFTYETQCSRIHSCDTHLWADRWMTGGQSTRQGGRDGTSTRDVRLPGDTLQAPTWVPPHQSHSPWHPQTGKVEAAGEGGQRTTPGKKHLLRR